MLRFDFIEILSAEQGRDSNLPDFSTQETLPFFVCDDSVDEQQRKKVGTGMYAGILPYKMQNRYSRQLEKRRYRAAILENNQLRAVFLPELGGRLWSLFDKATGRDLLYCNSAIRYGNLALCNAWFAGGAEWNIGVKGHSPLTNRPLFAARAIGTDGREYLKMWEYEPIRKLVYVMFFHLEENRLVAHMEVENVGKTDSLMYWWSNIAIPQSSSVCVAVPTDKTYVTSYRDGSYCLSRHTFPSSEKEEGIRPCAADVAVDYFYDIPAETDKWLATVDEASGYGFLHVSSPRLLGRKAFFWGTKNGGRHWNAWLTDDRGQNDYFEVQAGLAKTQFEHFPIAAGERIAWTEVYTSFRLPLPLPDHPALLNAIGSIAGPLVPSENKLTEKTCDVPIVMGSGRGAIAERLHGRLSSLCTFPQDSVGKGEKYYADLLEGRSALATEDTDFANDPAFIPILSQKQEKDERDWLLLALIYFANRDENAAETCLKQSLAVAEKAYNLTAFGAFLTHYRKQHREALSVLRRAMQTENPALDTVRLYAEVCLRGGAAEEWVSAYPLLPPDLRQNGRLTMYMGQALVACGRYREALKYINTNLCVPDIREGEYAISRIYVAMWRGIYKTEQDRNCTEEEVLAAHPLPLELDFRMH